MAIVTGIRAESGLLVLWRNRVLVEARGRVPYLAAPESFEFPQQPIALDADAGGPAGFVQLDASQDGLAQLSEGAEAPLRFIDPMFELGRAEGAVRRALVRALAVARWSETTQFCAQCGLALVWGRTRPHQDLRERGAAPALAAPRSIGDHARERRRADAARSPADVARGDVFHARRFRRAGRIGRRDGRA